jgi:hypothetical protein
MSPKQEAGQVHILDHLDSTIVESQKTALAKIQMPAPASIYLKVSFTSKFGDMKEQLPGTKFNTKHGN